MSVFERNDNYLLKIAGDVWEANVNAKCMHFFGIFDQENVLGFDEAGHEVLGKNSKLTVHSVTAEDFSIGDILKRKSKNTTWVIRDIHIEDDGALTSLTIVQTG